MCGHQVAVVSKSQAPGPLAKSYRGHEQGPGARGLSRRYGLPNTLMRQLGLQECKPFPQGLVAQRQRLGMQPPCPALELWWACPLPAGRRPHGGLWLSVRSIGEAADVSLPLLRGPGCGRCGDALQPISSHPPPLLEDGTLSPGHLAFPTTKGRLLVQSSA